MSPQPDLAAENAALRGRVDALAGELGALESELAVLREQILWFKRQLFGSKSERLESRQMLLKLEQLESLAQRLEQARRQTITYERTAAPGEKRPLAAETFAKLPVKETLVIEPDEVKAAPQAYERISEEKTFEVDVIPPVLYKREIIRPKYRLKKDLSQPPLLAPAPARAVSGGHASAGLLAWIALGKYVDHLPLYRLEQMSGRWGARLPRQSMADWIGITAEWLDPIYKHMRKDLLGGGYIQADETPVKFIDPDKNKGSAHQGYLWVISRPGSDVVFDWRLSRRHGELTTLIGENYEGILQSDGYEAYANYAREHPKVVWACCWAHARRKYFEAQESSPREARVALRLIGRLYAWERRWNEKPVTDAPERARLRKTHFERHLKWLHFFAQHWRKNALPKSPLGLACNYLLEHWKPLCAHLEHGQTRLDNNLVENAIRPTALGKKNWLFVGHPDAGQRSAIIYSIVVSCKRHGIDAHTYLRDVLTRLPAMTNRDDVGALTPARWQAMSANTSVEAATL
jgi:transposase